MVLGAALGELALAKRDKVTFLCSPSLTAFPSWIEQLKAIDTPTLSNAIELLKVRPRQDGFTPLSVRALFPEFGRMCGYAVTAQVETVTKTVEFDMARFVELYRAIENAPKPAERPW